MGKAMQPKPASGTNLLALPEGTELVGDYRIKRVLGAGGFGITYLAEEIALGRLVTIKEYFPADFAARIGAINASPRSQGSVIVTSARYTREGSLIIIDHILRWNM